MKFLMTALLLSFGVSAFAEEKEMFSKLKEHRLANIEQRMSHLQELKSCVSSASNNETLKNCHKAHKEKTESLKDKNKSWRAGVKEERKSRKENKKK